MQDWEKYLADNPDPDTLPPLSTTAERKIRRAMGSFDSNPAALDWDNPATGQIVQAAARLVANDTQIVCDHERVLGCDHRWLADEFCPVIRRRLADSRIPVVGESSGYVMPSPVHLDSDRDDTGIRYLAACGKYTHPAPMARQPLVNRQEAAELLVESLAEFLADLAKVNQLAILSACGS